MLTNEKMLGVREIEDRFTQLTLLMYDTSVPRRVLEEQVYPHLGPTIEFVDPWILARGRRKFITGLRGFHCAIRFTFDIFQINVQMNEQGNGGRVLVDGVMNLNQLVIYTYPLRTILAYDFTMTKGGESFQITRLEEMWSYADMIQNVPLLGKLYNASRVVGGYFFTGLFWLACAVRERSFHGTGEA